MQFSRHSLALILSSSAFLLLAYAAAGFWGVPLLARSQLQKFAELTLHRRLSLGSVQFNPFTFELRATELALKEPDGSDLLGFKQLYLDAELASLWQRRINLKQVLLEAPTIKLAIDAQGRFNLSQLFPAGDRASLNANAAMPKISIGQISVKAGRVAFSDLSHSTGYQRELQQVDISLTDFRTDAGHANTYSIAAQTTQNEQLETSGEFAVEPQAASGRFTLSHLQLPPVASYLAAPPFQLTDGRLSIEGKYKFFTAAATSRALQWQLTLTRMTGENIAITAINAVSSRPAIMMPGIIINDVLVTPADRKVSISQVLLQSPSIEISRDSAGEFNLARLLASSTAQAPVSPAQSAIETVTAANLNSNQSPSLPPWQLTIIDTRIETGTVEVADNAVTPAAHFVLQPISVQIANLGTGTEAMHLSGTAAIDSDARLKFAGNLGLAPLQAGLALDLDNFALSSLQPYLEQQTRLSVKSGLFALHGHVDYRPDVATAAEPNNATMSGPTIAFAGEINVENLHSADKSTGVEFVDWKLLSVKGINATVNASSAQLTILAIDSVSAEQAYANVQIAADKSLNVSHLLAASGSQNAGAAVTRLPNDQLRIQTTSAPAKPLIQIETIKIIDSAADFGDRSLEPNFSTGIVDLNGAVTGLSSRTAARAVVAMQGKVDRYSPVDIAGEISPFSAKSFSDLTIKFSNIDLTTFNPYSGKYAGYNITKGKLAAQMRYQIVDSKLDAQHHVVVNNLEFGNKTDSKDAAPIPLKLAVALLKDSNGVITADLPVSGTLDDPQFRLAPLVWKAFVGLLGNVASAPFAALGRLFGGGDELAYVEFQAGVARLDPNQSNKLTTLAKALVERPGLSLNIPLNTTSTADLDAMAQQALHALAPLTADAAARAIYLATLELEYKNRSGQAMAYAAVAEADAAAPVPADALRELKILALEQALPPLLRPDADALADLGRRRAEAVEALLLSNTALLPERIFLINEEVSATKLASRGTVVTAAQMELHLQ